MQGIGCRIEAGLGWQSRQSEMKKTYNPHPECQVAFEGGTSGLKALIDQHLATLGASMGDRFSRNIKPQLEAGAK